MSRYDPSPGRGGYGAGKVILLGEHAVVYGRPAVASAIGRGVSASIHPRRGGRLLSTDAPVPASDDRPEQLVRAAAELLGISLDGLGVRVRSTLPHAAGLGSSAAFTVAVVRALAAHVGRSSSPAETFDIGRRLERIFHGHPSGIDIAAATFEATFRFVSSNPPCVDYLESPCPFDVVVAWVDGGRSSADVVQHVRTGWARDRNRYERVFDDIAGVVSGGVEALRIGNRDAFGVALDANHELLATLQVSTPALDALVRRARRAGAFGAKLTGAGGGGAIVALAGDGEGLAEDLRGLAADVLVTRIGCRLDSDLPLLRGPSLESPG